MGVRSLLAVGRSGDWRLGNLVSLLWRVYRVWMGLFLAGSAQKVEVLALRIKLMLFLPLRASIIELSQLDIRNKVILFCLVRGKRRGERR